MQIKRIKCLLSKKILPISWIGRHNSDENPLNLCADLVQLKEDRDATKTFPPGQDLKANGLLKILRNRQLSCDTIFS